MRAFGLHVLANTLGSLAAAAIIYLAATVFGYVDTDVWLVILSLLVTAVAGAAVGWATYGSGSDLDRLLRRHYLPWLRRRFGR